MPEGPEVTRITVQLNGFIKNHTNSILEKIEPISGRYLKSPIDGLSLLSKDLPLEVNSIQNKGKFIYWNISNQYFIFSTLGMTGGYSPSQDKYSRVKFSFSCGNCVYYTDMRNFGTLKVVQSENELKKKLVSIGPDMLNSPCSDDEWLLKCQKHKDLTLVNFLMEQKVVSGVGNIYKSEALYLSSLYPGRKIKDCSRNELLALRKAVIDILQRSYTLGGSTIRDYKDFYGVEGGYTAVDPAAQLTNRYTKLVYQRDKDDLGNRVQKGSFGDGRTTFWVPEVQRVSN